MLVLPNDVHMKSAQVCEDIVTCVVFLEQMKSCIALCMFVATGGISADYGLFGLSLAVVPAVVVLRPDWLPLTQLTVIRPE